jgi:hypothetical protein
MTTPLAEAEIEANKRIFFNLRNLTAISSIKEARNAFVFRVKEELG